MFYRYSVQWERGKTNCGRKTAIHIDDMKHAIRQIVNSFFFQNRIANIRKIVGWYPKRRRYSKYGKIERKIIIIEKTNIVTWSEGRRIHYLKKTAVNQENNVEKYGRVWTMKLPQKKYKFKKRKFLKLRTGLEKKALHIEQTISKSNCLKSWRSTPAISRNI